MKAKHAVVLLTAATFGLVAAGCGDDDDDDTIDETLPGNPDLDPGAGSGLPGDADDEGTDAPEETVTTLVVETTEA